MRRMMVVSTVAVVAATILAFEARSKFAGVSDQPQDSPRILYYVDPMHPSYRSDKPGIAPDCNMALQAVYEKRPERKDAARLAGSTLSVLPEVREVNGIRFGTAEKSSMRFKIRTVGRIVADENRIHPITAPTEGRIDSVGDVRTGSLVRQGQLIASFRTREIQTPQQAYFYALNTLDGFRRDKMDSPEQVAATTAQIRSAEEALLSMGMGQDQLRRIAGTRRPEPAIELRSPVAGQLVSRNVFPNTSFERGVELFRIVDLTRLYILADLHESDAKFLQFFSSARVFRRADEKPIPVSFVKDPPLVTAPGSLYKVRFEISRPTRELLPEMIVDVEIFVVLPPMLMMSADAVLETGTRHIAFVESADHKLHQRSVHVGFRVGDKVQIIDGIEPGEKISLDGGTFLLDSESRLPVAQ